MYVPTATYRLQFGPSFGFKDAEALVPYLQALGVSDIYASPIFRATGGSTHGYDVTDPNELNPELGGAEDFSGLTAKRSEYNVGWLQDIVPNHMAYNSENSMLMDVFRKGRDSKYFDFFDIAWDHPDESLRGRVLAPFLGKPFSEAIRDGEIQIEPTDSGPAVRYYDILFPLSLSSCGGAESAAEMPPLDSLLEKQLFKLSTWERASRSINYRRFFYLNDFIALKVEKPEVFGHTHQVISEFINRGVFTGLRIDHIDGLYDPAQYLGRLRRLVGDRYIVVEKILDLDESLPARWPVQGTTGYEFCNYLNGIFIRRENEAAFTEIYREFTDRSQRYDELLAEKKRAICQKYMAGDIEYLVHLLRVAAKDRRTTGGDVPQDAREALVEIIVAFRVYRTYVNDRGYSIDDRTYMKEAINNAKSKNPALTDTIDLVGQFLLLDLPEAETADTREKTLEFVLKFQQLTGPVMAKGFEDTLLYGYNRLVSLNEVGSNPDRFGVSLKKFHEFNAARAAHWPHSLNATSTHDTKRGEDVRARINVLTEMPEMWSAKVRRWRQINSGFKSDCRGEPAPDANDEYLLYQTLVGALPFDAAQFGEFKERIREYMIKVVREAKEHSAWVEQNVEYERACLEFIDRILDPFGSNEFWGDFLPFQKQIAAYGVFNSLSQTLLKMTAPGLPDFYQGAELWDFSLVDPDNRRPVDYEKRTRLLDEIRDKQPGAGRQLIEDLLGARNDGRIKLFLILKVLAARRQRREVFEGGDYQQLTVRGRHREHIVGCLRRCDAQYAATIAPRFLAGLVGVNEMPLGTDVWQDTEVLWPASADGDWRDAITGESVRIEKATPVGRILSGFPVSLLMRECVDA